MAIVGSGPGVLDNRPGFIDSHDIVVRVNNYKLSEAAGHRADVFYSFFGVSIRKTATELRRDGVKLCMCKCPNGQPIRSDWHSQQRRMNGVDFAYIYQNRENWWFCDTYVPDNEEFLVAFKLLGKHVPTTGFSAVHTILGFRPESVYLTGFDFFASGIHNVNEPWRPGNPDDPIKHEPLREFAWLIGRRTSHPLSFDRRLTEMMEPAFV